MSSSKLVNYKPIELNPRVVSHCDYYILVLLSRVLECGVYDRAHPVNVSSTSGRHRTPTQKAVGTLSPRLYVSVCGPGSPPQRE